MCLLELHFLVQPEDLKSTKEFFLLFPFFFFGFSSRFSNNITIKEKFLFTASNITQETGIRLSKGVNPEWGKTPGRSFLTKQWEFRGVEQWAVLFCLCRDRGQLDSSLVQNQRGYLPSLSQGLVDTGREPHPSRPVNARAEERRLRRDSLLMVSESVKCWSAVLGRSGGPFSSPGIWLRCLQHPWVLQKHQCREPSVRYPL